MGCFITIGSFEIRKSLMINHNNCTGNRTVSFARCANDPLDLSHDVYEWFLCKESLWLLLKRWARGDTVLEEAPALSTIPSLTTSRQLMVRDHEAEADYWDRLD